MHYPADCADFSCSRAAVYSVAHAKHSTDFRVPLYTLPSTAVYRVEGRHFTPQDSRCGPRMGGSTASSLAIVHFCSVGRACTGYVAVVTKKSINLNTPDGGRVKSVSSRVQRHGHVHAGRGGIYLRCRPVSRAQPDLHSGARGVGMFCVKYGTQKARTHARGTSWESVGRSEVRADGSGVMPQDCSNVSSTRGPRNDEALPSSTPNCHF